MNKRLTATVLSALRPKAKPYYVSDDLQVGLRVRIAPSGALTWNVAFRMKGGSTKSTSLGPCDPSGKRGLGLADARARAAEIVKAARQGRDLIADEHEQRRVQEQRLTVAELIERYARSIGSSHRKGGALRTADDIERRLKRALAPEIRSAAENVSRADISGLLDPVAAKYPREAEKRRQVIGAMFRWGVAKGYVANDPTFGSEAYGRGDPRNRVLTTDEIKAVWEWLDAGADHMAADCISALRLQLCLGARIGEVAGMQVAEFDRDGGNLIWTLPAARSKNKAQRHTPIVGRAREIVESHLGRVVRGPVFRTILSQKPLTSADVGQALKNRELPCSHFSSHDLRRTVVSAMDELGIALDTIAAVVGHQRGSRDTRTLIRHYSRPRLDERIEGALLAWDNKLSEIIAGRRHDDNNVVPLRVASMNPQG